MHNTPRLMIIENDLDLYNEHYPAWKSRGMEVIRVSNMQAAIELLAREKNDFSMVGINADNVVYIPMLKILCDATSAYIHVLTSKYCYDEDVKATVAGADHYGEWLPDVEKNAIRGVARMHRAIERNNRPKQAIRYLSYKNIFVCLTNRKIYVDSIETHRATQKEFDLLRLLIGDSDRVFTYRQILRNVWGAEYLDSDNALIWSVVKRLRKKIKITTATPDYIINIKDVGYVFDPS